jgi:hypothetical protein
MKSTNAEDTRIQAVLPESGIGVSARHTVAENDTNVKATKVFEVKEVMKIFLPALRSF